MCFLTGVIYYWQPGNLATSWQPGNLATWQPSGNLLADLSAGNLATRGSMSKPSMQHLAPPDDSPPYTITKASSRAWGWPGVLVARAVAPARRCSARLTRSQSAEESLESGVEVGMYRKGTVAAAGRQ
eukprot:7011618-Prymnesium_polylepis.1